jgi:hypothetical protein
MKPSHGEKQAAVDCLARAIETPLRVSDKLLILFGRSLRMPCESVRFPDWPFENGQIVVRVDQRSAFHAEIKMKR